MVKAPLKVFPRGRVLLFLKERTELSYWRRRVEVEGTLGNAHYEPFFTTFFGIDRGFYEGKVIADIGCGPRGSLEWAPENCEAIGIDPLADKYQELGASKHRMRYVKAAVESLPFEDGHFDAVFSFNNLDHVESIPAAVAEIRRVLKPGGMFLLIVEINHLPRLAEPHTLSGSITGDFRMEVLDRRFYNADGAVFGCYETLADERWRCDDDGKTPMWLAAKLRRS